MRNVSDIYRKIVEKASDPDEAAELLLMLHKSMKNGKPTGRATPTAPAAVQSPPAAKTANSQAPAQGTKTKQCGACGKNYPLDEFSYYDVKNKKRYRQFCKSCFPTHGRGHAPLQIDQATMETVIKQAGDSRKCTICEEAKSTSEYAVRKSHGKYTLSPYCKGCTSKYWKLHNQLSKDGKSTKGVIDQLKKEIKSGMPQGAKAMQTQIDAVNE